MCCVGSYLNFIYRKLNRSSYSEEQDRLGFHNISKLLQFCPHLLSRYLGRINPYFDLLSLGARLYLLNSGQASESIANPFLAPGTVDFRLTHYRKIYVLFHVSNLILLLPLPTSWNRQEDTAGSEYDTSLRLSCHLPATFSAATTGLRAFTHNPPLLLLRIAFSCAG